MSNTLGRHILVEFFACSSKILNDVISIEEHMVSAAKETQATVINSTFHHFSPYGVSGVVVIQESHLAIHTWPEYRYAAVDLFTCGDEVNPWLAYDYLKKAFEAAQGSAMEIKRGTIDLLERIDVQTLEKSRGEMKTNCQLQFKRDVWFTNKDENIALSIRHTGNRLYRKKSKYQTVEVLETHAYGKMLIIDNIIMTTEKDEFIYHEMISHVALLSNPGIKKVLVIGGGDGGTIREVLRHEHLEQVTMVEIDENVIEASKLHLPSIASAFSHPKLQLLIYDGIKYLADCPAETFDMIIVDGSDPLGPAEGLFTQEFYTSAYRCLTANGVLTLQSEGPYFSTDVFINLDHCLKDIFGQNQVHCYLAYIPTYPTGMWSFHYASKSSSVHPIEGLDDERAQAFAEAQELKYYNAGVHRAAFALPNFVVKMLTRP